MLLNTSDKELYEYCIRKIEYGTMQSSTRGRRKRVSNVQSKHHTPLPHYHLKTPASGFGWLWGFFKLVVG